MRLKPIFCLVTRLPACAPSVITRRGTGLGHLVCSRDYYKSQRRCSCKYGSTGTVIKMTILPTNLHTWPLMLVIRIWL